MHLFSETIQRHVPTFFIYFQDMNQMSLITPIDVCQRKICLDNIQALFTENMDGSYDVVLEINSNKFLIAVHNIANQIESLEVIATK